MKPVSQRMLVRAPDSAPPDPREPRRSLHIRGGPTFPCRVGPGGSFSSAPGTHKSCRSLCSLATTVASGVETSSAVGLRRARGTRSPHALWGTWKETVEFKNTSGHDRDKNPSVEKCGDGRVKGFRTLRPLLVVYGTIWHQTNTLGWRTSRIRYWSGRVATDTEIRRAWCSYPGGQSSALRSLVKKNRTRKTGVLLLHLPWALSSKRLELRELISGTYDMQTGRSL